MANVQTVTLEASVVATVTLDKDANKIVVLNMDGTDEVWFNINETTDPEPEADGCWVLPAAVGGVDLPVTGAGNTRVKLISEGTPRVLVGALS
jgi:hypothetical protein